MNSEADKTFENLCGYVGVQAGMVGLFFFYSHVASVIFTSFSTQMSATNLLFTYLLFVGTNILILLRGKQCPKERGACGTKQ